MEMLGNASKRELHFYCLCLNGFWNFAFFISALVVWGACYYDPCEEGEGLADSMDVDGQMSFTCFTTAVTFMAHTGYGILLWKRQANATEYAQYQGFTIGLIVITFNTMILWAGQDMLEAEFTVHGDSTESGRLMTPNTSLETTFGALATFACFTLFSHIALLYSMVYWKDELTDTTNFGTANSGTSMLGSGNGQVSSGGQYQDL